MPPTTALAARTINLGYRYNEKSLALLVFRHGKPPLIETAKLNGVDPFVMLRTSTTDGRLNESKIVSGLEYAQGELLMHANRSEGPSG